MRGRAMILLFVGRVVDAHEEVKRAIEKFGASSEGVRLAARAAGQDAGAAGLALMSWAVWLLGDINKAHALILAADQRADAVEHPHTHAYVCYYACVLHALQGEPALALQNAERCLSLSEEHGFGQWRNLSRVVRGISTTMLGPSSDPLALDDVRNAFNDYRRSGYALGVTALDVLWCPAGIAPRTTEAALEVIDQGIFTANQNGERIFEAELYRLRSRAARTTCRDPSECAGVAPSGIENGEASKRAIAGTQSRKGSRRALDGSGQTRRSYRPSQVYCGVVSGWPRHAKLKGDKGRRLIDNDKGCLSNPRRLLPYPPLLRLRLLFLVYDSGMSCRIFPAVGFLLIFFVSSIGRQIPTLFPFFEIAL